MPSAKSSPAKTRDKFEGHGKNFRIGGVTRQARPRPKMREVVKGAAAHIVYADNSRTIANPDAYYAEENIRLGVRPRCHDSPLRTGVRVGHGPWPVGVGRVFEERLVRFILSTLGPASSRHTTQHASHPTQPNPTKRDETKRNEKKQNQPVTIARHGRHA